MAMSDHKNTLNKLLLFFIFCTSETLFPQHHHDTLIGTGTLAMIQFNSLIYYFIFQIHFHIDISNDAQLEQKI